MIRVTDDIFIDDGEIKEDFIKSDPQPLLRLNKGANPFSQDWIGHPLRKDYQDERFVPYPWDDRKPGGVVRPTTA